MKQFLTLLLLATMNSQVYAQDISLNGLWSMTIQDKEYEVTIPHTYNVMDGLEDYAGKAVYKRTLPVTADMHDKTLRLHFGAVYHDAIVYVNGIKVGEHLNKGYTPFSFDITRYIKWDGENTLEVQTSNAYTEHGLPYKRSFDWCNDGGIYRDVWLHISGKRTIRYVHATPHLNGAVDFSIRLFDDKTKSIRGQLTISERGTGKIVSKTTKNLKKANGSDVFTMTAKITDPLLWDFDHPNLYDFTFNIPDNDTLTDHFGFREFKVVGTSFVLNGDTVRLPGIESMAGSNPLYGTAEPEDYIRRNIDLMKELNTTITRYHWPQDNCVHNVSDENGILSIEQIPWWQKPENCLGRELHANALEQMEEMIEAHYNHPSIISWGTSNEVSGIHDDLRSLGEKCRLLDSSRMVIDFSNSTYHALDKSTSCVLDVPTWNEYTGTWHGGKREDLPERLTKIHEAIPGRPLFITEVGLCEPAFVGGDSRRIDDMLYHIGQYQKCDYIPGYIYFCLQDYRTQMGEEGLGKWRIRRHGVTRADLTPKASFSVLRQLMAPLDIIEVMPANSSKTGDALAGQIAIDVTDHDAAITLKVKNSIPSYVLRGYTLEYNDSRGDRKVVNMPDMLPGNSYRFILRDINAQYHFGIVRPNGFRVIEY